MKKLIFLLLCLMLTLSCLPALSEEPAPETLTSGDYEYRLLEDGTAEIARYAGDAENLTVPAELDGHPVTAIGKGAFYECDSLAVVLPEGVARIGDYAFFDCAGLTAVTLPGSLTAIGEAAFAWCESLADVALPEGLTAIGDRAFDGCGRLTAIAIPDSVARFGANPFSGCTHLKAITVSPDHPVLEVVDGVLFGKADKRLVCYPPALEGTRYEVPRGVAVIDTGAFNGCQRLEAIALPDSVTAIGDEAFFNCERLADLALPGGVTEIGSRTFFYCESLVEFSIPDGVTRIGEEAFAFCTGLTAVTIPDSAVEIDANPFANCQSLTTITVSPEHPALEMVDGVLLGKADRRLICYPCALAATSYEVPQGVAVIGDGAFYGCSSLTSLTLPDGVTEIGVGAFWECESLTDLVIPDSVTQIADYAFYECPNLTVTVGRDSCAKDYCEANGIPYTYADANDWLNS